ncbi:helix-turn-helix domain-containing protein [Nocardia tengchongensis]|uniref:helix-turn-helix domain-containing protein n=1 Tax=Nocardia tengchongensis TaxID=2055889 RepID=UPI0036AEB7F8
MALAVDPGQRHLEAVKLPPLIVASHTLHEALDTTTPPAMTDEQIRQARALLTRPDESVSSIARLLGISRSTIYQYVPEITTNR